MTEDVVALFDGDVIAYRAGFAAEKRYYFDSRSPPESGGTTWDYKKEIPKDIPQEFIEHERNLEPIENALQNVKSLISKCINQIQDLYPESNIHYFSFISGNKKKKNFRIEVDKTYKANRKKEHRPSHLQGILDFIVKNHNGYASEGCEADDFFGHAQSDALNNGKLPIIISIDKDLKQLAGLHMNLVTQEIQEVSPEQARMVFWRQMLQGDTADNIKGIDGIGETKSRRYLPDGTTDTEAKEIVCSYYQKEYANSWKETYNKNCKLLWIWRKIPDKCPYTLEEDYKDFD